MFCTAYPRQGQGEPRSFPRGLRVQGRGHLGQGIRALLHTQNLISQQYVYRLGEEISVHANSAHTGGNRTPNPNGAAQHTFTIPIH